GDAVGDSGGRRMAHHPHRGWRRSGGVGGPAGDRVRAALTPRIGGWQGRGFLAIACPMNQGVILTSGLMLGIWVYLVLLHGRYWRERPRKALAERPKHWPEIVAI